MVTPSDWFPTVTQKSLPTGIVTFKPESVHPRWLLFWSAAVVLAFDLEAPREGRGELPVDFEVVEAEDSFRGPTDSPTCTTLSAF